MSRWPDNKKFAFSIFDDTDCTTLQNAPIVYDSLRRYNIRITKSVWMFDGEIRDDNKHIIGETCQNNIYLKWVLKLKEEGHEIAYHGTSFSASKRERIIEGLETFKSLFGEYPKILTQHNDTIPSESIYWGVNRVSGINRMVYKIIMFITRKPRNIYHGESIESPFYWGDICKERIKYVRNFTYSNINTLRDCPMMPYYDPKRPFVNFWFASTEGANVNSFNACLSEENQNKLENEGGACIMYTHFGKDFVENGSLNSQFQSLIAKIADRDGWFVPVSDILDYLLDKKGNAIISNAERAILERKWLINKIKIGPT